MSRVSHALEERYFERMAVSLGDKMKIVEQLPAVTNDYSPKVLDIGAGGGEFAHALSELGYTVTALDANRDSIEHIRQNFPEITTKWSLANYADDFVSNFYDAVVCSSILHEVYSYGDDERDPGDLKSVETALKSFLHVLKPGGVLVIRDGVKPRGWSDSATVRIVNGDDEAVRLYLEQCPFANAAIPGVTGKTVQLTQLKLGLWSGNLRSAYEFYMTYNWGVENYHREANELYGIMSLSEYSSLLQYVGFELVSAESWVQPGYSEYLPKKVQLLTSDGVNRWPDTNALWVARK